MAHFTGLEPLEGRVYLSAVLFVDFGDNFPSGSLVTTQGAFRDVAGASGADNEILGTELVDAGGNFNAATRLDIVAQSFTATNRAQMMAVVERAYEPLDVEVVELTAASQTTNDGRTVAGAASMTDVINMLRDGATAMKDAYIFVATFIVDPLGGANTQVYTGGGGLSPNDNGLDTSDLTDAANGHDDIGVVYSAGGFSNNTLNNISHEAGHLFGLQHAITNATTSATTNLLHQAEIMSYRNTNNTTSSTFTRYPMTRGDDNSPASGVLVDYNDLAARKGQVTLHDQLRLDGNVLPDPGLTFVSGTGAHDIITITKNGANADVTVQAFADAAYTTAITVPGEADTTYSYSIPLTDTILVHAGDSNDSIIVDGDLGVDIRIDGMLGTDTLTVNGKGAGSAVYTPNAVAPVGVDLVADYGGTLAIGGNSIIFNDFEFAASLLTVTDVGTLTLQTPGAADILGVNSPSAGTNQVSGSSDGVAFVPLNFADITSFVLDAATNDGAAGNDVIDLNSALVASGLQYFTVNSGSSSDTDRFDINVNDISLPVAGGAFAFNGGTGGVDTLDFTTASSTAVTYTPDGFSDPSRGTLTFGGASLSFTGLEFVEPVTPVITSVAISSTSINENDSVTLTGSFTDPGSLSSHTVTINWGDGGGDMIVNLDVGDRSFAIDHQYLDDNPTGTPLDVNTVTVKITDNDSLSDSDSSLSVAVHNVDPVITDLASDATFEDKAEEGEPVNILAHFTDTGTLDTHTAVIDWGDGTVEPATLVQGAGSGTITGTHPYVAGGIYTITVTLTDDDTGTHQLDTIAVVTGVGLNGGVLYIIGSAQDDSSHVEQTGKGVMKVHASFVPEKFRKFDVADVDKIISYLCNGDDRLTIANKVKTPAVIHGGAGNDHLHAGGGVTVLLGDEGDDMLVGQSGRNILIGGAGQDRLVGGGGSDVLIGGSTDMDSDDDALMSAAMAWGDEAESYVDRTIAIAATLTVTDDGDEDKLTGSSSRDLFYEGLGDILTDLDLDETVI